MISGVCPEERWGRVLLGEDFEDVGEVHFEAVLVFVDGLGHPFELAGGVEFGRRFAVDVEVTEGRFILRTSGECGFGEVEVVGGTQDEDSFAVGTW